MFSPGKGKGFAVSIPKIRGSLPQSDCQRTPVDSHTDTFRKTVLQVAQIGSHPAVQFQNANRCVLLLVNDIRKIRPYPLISPDIKAPFIHELLSTLLQ